MLTIMGCPSSLPWSIGLDSTSCHSASVLLLLSPGYRLNRQAWLRLPCGLCCTR